MRIFRKYKSNIHEKGFVHRDFHSGNILKGDGFDALITDLGLSRPADQDQKDNTIHGVLPYVAPEVLMKNKYTEKSDIYSLGMICYEVIAGIPPFHDVPHQAHLAFDIIKGLRPKFKIKVPKKIHEMIYEWWLDLDVPNFDSEFYKQYDEADTDKHDLTDLQESTNNQLVYTTHVQAVYRSRVLDIPSSMLCDDEGM
ncbi:8627_t:CDS:2 [Funneliformis geosporum]|uniref:8627_t:CDS:1 n=1 Tax=Funneliformis geosporum TaxID=1117311 RepID=A0A9W4SPC3_9GLOM|nr:8627_t:CDS:2 [Funneliformis geosporum]